MSGEITFTYDSSLYSPDAIHKAAYKGMNHFTFILSTNGKDFLCELKKNIKTSDQAFLIAVDEFKKDVIDYQLREKIKLETEPIRNLILSIAFSKTGL